MEASTLRGLRIPLPWVCQGKVGLPFVGDASVWVPVYAKMFYKLSKPPFSDSKGKNSIKTVILGISFNPLYLSISSSGNLTQAFSKAFSRKKPFSSCKWAMGQGRVGWTEMCTSYQKWLGNKNPLAMQMLCLEKKIDNIYFKPPASYVSH